MQADWVRYLPIVPILIVLANLGDDQHLRIHHYMYALLAIPVLSLPNRVSLFFQAMMLGLFLDGVGRWGWASIVETTDSVCPQSLHLLNVGADELVTWRRQCWDLYTDILEHFQYQRGSLDGTE